MVRVELGNIYLIHAFPTTGKTTSFFGKDEEEDQSELKDLFDDIRYSITNIDGIAVIKLDMEIRDGETLTTIQGDRFSERMIKLDRSAKVIKEALTQKFEKWILFSCVNRFTHTLEKYAYTAIEKLVIIRPIDYSKSRMVKIGREDLLEEFGDSKKLEEDWLVRGMQSVVKYMEITNDDVITLKEDQFVNDIIRNIVKTNL